MSVEENDFDALTSEALEFSHGRAQSSFEWRMPQESSFEEIARASLAGRKCIRTMEKVI